MFLALKANVTLTELNLEGNCMRVTGAKMLAEFLGQSGLQNLRLLDISDNDISSYGDDFSAVHSLANSLRVNSTLRGLHLARNNIEETCVEAFAEAMRDNATLCDLVLLSEEEAIAVHNEAGLKIIAKRT